MPLVRMLQGKDLYFPGELIDLPDASAQTYISAGVAELALCPECGAQLEATGSGVYCPECGAQLEARGYGAVCPECGAKKWEGIL